MSELADLHWTQVSDDSSWHLIARTYVSRASLFFVETRCGIEREWDQTFLDRLPGGSEKGCENCLTYFVGDVDTDSDPSTKKKSKSK